MKRWEREEKGEGVKEKRGHREWRTKKCGRKGKGKK